MIGKFRKLALKLPFDKVSESTNRIRRMAHPRSKSTSTRFDEAASIYPSSARTARKNWFACRRLTPSSS